MPPCAKCGPKTASHLRREYAPYGYVLTAANGTVSHYATRLQADAANSKTGYSGTVERAYEPFSA